MSEQSSTVTPEHFRYIAARTAGEDDLLRGLKAAATAEGIPPIWVAPEQASMIQIFLEMARARDVVEIGTLAGYSAINMARALPEGGMVRTIEINPKHAAFAKAWVAKSDVARKVEVFLGGGMDVLPTFADNSADAAFLDADKGSYGKYLEECLRIVRRGGFIMVDNAFAFGQLLAANPTDPEVGAVRAFNELMAREQRLHSIIVPIGDGMWVGVRR